MLQRAPISGPIAQVAAERGFEPEWAGSATGRAQHRQYSATGHVSKNNMLRVGHTATDSEVFHRCPPPSCLHQGSGKVSRLAWQ